MLVAASAHFVDKWCPFRWSFGCILSLNQIFWKQWTIRQYRSDLSDQSALVIRFRIFRLDWELYYKIFFLIFHAFLSVRWVCNTFGTHAFSVTGPTVWNSLPDHLRNPAVDSEQFRRDLKTYLFAGHLKFSALEGCRAWLRNTSNALKPSNALNFKCPANRYVFKSRLNWSLVH